MKLRDLKMMREDGVTHFDATVIEQMSLFFSAKRGSAAFGRNSNPIILQRPGLQVMRVSDFFQSIRRGFSSSSARRHKAAAWASQSAEILEFRELMTAQVTQFADLNVTPETASSDPQELTAIGNTLYFTAADKTHGRELWKKDGASPAVLVKDIFVGTQNSGLRELTAVGSTLFFTAVYATDNPRVGPGRELWKTDGTSAGTVLVKDIVNIPISTMNGYQWSSNPTNLINNNGTLYFTANDMINGQELWISDGTAAGTMLFHDLTGDAGSSHPQNLTAINGRIFASVMSESTGREGVSAIDVFTPASPSITAPAARATQSQRPTITWSASPTTALPIGTYRVWMRAISSTGVVSDWSEPLTFTITA